MSSDARKHPSNDNPSKRVHTTVGIHPGTQTRLKHLAHELRPLVGCYVPQWSLIQAAVTWWLRGVDLNSAEFVATIRADHTKYSGDTGARPLDGVALVAVGFGMSRVLRSQLDELTSNLSPMDGRRVSRSTLIRTALVFWLSLAELLPQEVVQALRDELIPLCPPPEEAVKLHRSLADLPILMLRRIDALANQATLSLGCTVSRPTILRAAVLRWLTEIDGLDVQAVFQQIQSIAPPPTDRLYPCMVAWSKAIHLRLLELAKQLVPSTYRSIRQALAAVLLTAVTPWMKEAEREPSAAFEAIRATNIKRGRGAAR